VVARFVSLPSAPAAEWESRAAKLLGAPARETHPRRSHRNAQQHDGKREAAVPLWKQIVGTSATTDFFFRAVYEKAQGRQPQFAILPNPGAVNQFAAILDKP
jgi:hypothetical protein